MILDEATLTLTPTDQQAHNSTDDSTTCDDVPPALHEIWKKIEFWKERHTGVRECMEKLEKAPCVLTFIKELWKTYTFIHIPMRMLIEHMHVQFLNGDDPFDATEFASEQRTAEFEAVLEVHKSWSKKKSLAYKAVSQICACKECTVLMNALYIKYTVVRTVVEFIVKVISELSEH